MRFSQTDLVWGAGVSYTRKRFPRGHFVRFRKDLALGAKVSSARECFLACLRLRGKEKMQLPRPPSESFVDVTS